MTQQVVIANFGNESIALIQWCIAQKMLPLTVLSVDTGFQAEAQGTRVAEASSWLKQQGIEHKHLTATNSMQACVEDRGQFPSKKLQWCAGFLKGLAINEYLDEIDATCEATLLFAKRRATSRANQWHSEYSTSEHFADREVRYPLLDMDDETAKRLVNQAGFDWQSHQSLECMPCIHASSAMLLAMSENDIARLEQLELKLMTTMFEQPIREKIRSVSNGAEKAHYLEGLDMSCGSDFGCGE